MKVAVKIDPFGFTLYDIDFFMIDPEKLPVEVQNGIGIRLFRLHIIHPVLRSDFHPGFSPAETAVDFIAPGDRGTGTVPASFIQ